MLLLQRGGGGYMTTHGHQICCVKPMAGPMPWPEPNTASPASSNTALPLCTLLVPICGLVSGGLSRGAERGLGSFDVNSLN